MANNAALFVAPGPLVDGSGNPYALAKLYFYTTGTDTPLDTYSSSALTSANTNPVVADANGNFGNIYLLANTSYKVVLKTSADATVWTRDPVQGINISVTPSVGLLRAYLAGLGMSNNVSAPNTIVDVAAGACADDTNAVALSLTAGSINLGTTGIDALDTGALAVTTTYHCFAIGKLDGTTSRLASASINSPTLPIGYSYKRRIGSVITNVSAQIRAFTQDGDDFYWTAPVADVAATNPGTTAVLRSLTVPTGLSMKAEVQGLLVNFNTSAGLSTVAYFSDPSANDSTPVGAVLHDFALAATTGGGVQSAASRMRIRTDTSARIRTRLSFSDGNVGLTINTLGWTDRRGRDS